MILSLLCLLSAGAWADEAPQDSPAERTEDSDTLAEYRLPFSVLAERSIGMSSKSVEYNWRDSAVQVAATGTHYFELNNYSSMRAGALVRMPSEGLIYELALTRVWVWDSPASEQLALTPYRQPGRPSRLEVDLNVGLPVAEGVVTAMPRRFPASQLVFSVYAGLRYAVYPMSYEGVRGRELASSLVSPALSDEELENLEDRRLDAMQIDPARYSLVAGFGNELYLSQGVFLAPRVMFNVPLFVGVTESDLILWADFSLSLGVAF
ncbi:MAG: hypothetical protein VX899_06185 [Myxococcota bacterium]|nr:hypothetical protein [Myxococcota bacterium]